ncbi:MAG: sensor histidine kinase [Wujia sp.]
MLVVLLLQEYIQKKQEKLSQTELALQQERNASNYFQAVQEQIDNRNILIHDIKNHIIVVQELCNANKTQEAYNYLNQLLELPALSRNIRLTPIQNLNIILNVYVTKCEQLHISFSVDCDPAFVDFMKVSHLTAMFCNLLDNSIEAAQNCDEPFITITLRYDEKIHTAKISIVNSCSQKPIFNSDNRLISSKPDREKHGLGVVSAERIVTLYNGNMLNYYDETTASFHTIIMLRNPEVL